MSTTHRCAHCRVPMEEGFVPEHSQGAVLQAGWHPGPPEATKFLGYEYGKKIERDKALPMQAWRCPTCGLVLLFAPAAAKGAKRK